MTTTTMTAEEQAAADAMSATARPKNDQRNYWGQVAVLDIWACVLEKGIGKRPFDPSRDDASQRRTAIKISVAPLRGEYSIDQDGLDFEAAWLDITRPSIIALGLSSPLGLRHAWVQVRREPTGETFDHKTKTAPDGRPLKVDKTGIAFIAIYPDRAACQAAADAYFGQFGNGNGNGSAPSAPTTGRNVPSPLPQADLPASDGERLAALKNLPVLWGIAQKTADPIKKMAELLKSSGYDVWFPPTSPEVQALTDPALPF